MKLVANKKINEESAPIKFTKKQLLKSKRYTYRQDALNALLKEGTSYSFDEVDKILEKFYKGGNK